jgi:predicted lipid-binding transport protein (Tim44 family)
MQRTETPNIGGAQRPTAGAATAGQALPGRFGGFGGGLMAGLLGAGLLGMMFGGGLFGGLSGLTSMLGLLLQVALIGGLIWLAVRFFRRRSEPATAAAGLSHGRSSLAGGASAGFGGGMGGLGGPSAAQAVPVAVTPLSLAAEDFSAFERALADIQAAYGREDLQALTDLATPEMIKYFGSDLEGNRSQGLRNVVSDAKLLQGDLAEAWLEGAAEYATVAMRFSAIDATVERDSGKVVAGDLTQPVEATELWTFRRDGGGPWMLSAIQQTA